MHLLLPKAGRAATEQAEPFGRERRAVPPQPSVGTDVLVFRPGPDVLQPMGVQCLRLSGDCWAVLALAHFTEGGGYHSKGWMMSNR